MEEASQHLVKPFIETCRRHHLRVTPQRLAVFRTIVMQRKHLSVEDVYRIVKKEIPGITFDTVNRTLLTFVEAGIAQLVEGLARQRRFDSRTEKHHHFHCIDCGKIIDIEHEMYEGLDVPDAIKKRFHVFSQRVVLQGLCDACLNSRNKQKTEHQKR